MRDITTEMMAIEAAAKRAEASATGEGFSTSYTPSALVCFANDTDDEGEPTPTWECDLSLFCRPLIKTSESLAVQVLDHFRRMVAAVEVEFLRDNLLPDSHRPGNRCRALRYVVETTDASGSVTLHDDPIEKGEADAFIETYVSAVPGATARAVPVVVEWSEPVTTSRPLPPLLVLITDKVKPARIVELPDPRARFCSEFNSVDIGATATPMV